MNRARPLKKQIKDTITMQVWDHIETWGYKIFQNNRVTSASGKLYSTLGLRKILRILDVRVLTRLQVCQGFGWQCELQWWGSWALLPGRWNTSPHTAAKHTASQTTWAEQHLGQTEISPSHLFRFADIDVCAGLTTHLGPQTGCILEIEAQGGLSRTRAAVCGAEVGGSVWKTPLPQPRCTGRNWEQAEK